MNIFERKQKIKSNLKDYILFLENLKMQLARDLKVLEKKKTINFCDDSQQIQKKSSKNIKNICDILTKTFKSTINAHEIDLKNSPCSFVRMQKTILRSLKIIRMERSNKIINMVNLHKITHDEDNNDNSSSPRLNTKYEHNLTQEIKISDEVKSDVEEETNEKNSQSNDNVFDKIEIMKINCNPEISPLNFEETQFKQNDSCDNDEDKNESEDLEMIVDDLDDTSSSSSSDDSSHEHHSDSDMTSDSVILTPTQVSHSTSSKDVPGKVFDNSLQFPDDFSPTSTKFRTRRLSENSFNSETSSFIVFDSDAESDDESFYTEELESEESDDDDNDDDNDDDDNDDNDDNIATKVRFDLKPKIHLMINWGFAYRAARKGNWGQIYADRQRFENRINETCKILERVLLPKHRENIYQTRFVGQDNGEKSIAVN